MAAEKTAVAPSSVPSSPENTVRTRRSRRRAGSTLGSDIPGDTSAPAVSTMPTTKASRAASRSRRRALSRGKDGQMVISSPTLFFTWYRELSYRNTWVNPLLVMILVAACYLPNPTPSNFVHDCLFLAYPMPKATPESPTMYGKGLRDLKFVGFYTFFFSFTREFVMQRFLRPLASVCLPLKARKNKGKVSRFMEQAYTAFYYIFMSPFGLYVMYNTPGLWYFNTTAFWEFYPNKLHTAVFKSYYLLQWSFWAQQAVVLMLQLEKPRKDFKELVLHHIVTLALITASWRFHYTYIGVAVFITHDISDFFLAVSKVLNYMDSALIGPFFAVFIGSWIYLRHYLNLHFLWSLVFDYEKIGITLLDWEEGIYKCPLAQNITIGLLVPLQLVNLFWLFYIVRIAYRFVRSWGEVAVDDRSDDEGDEEEEEEDSSSNGDENEKKITIDETPTITINGNGIIASGTSSMGKGRWRL